MTELKHRLGRRCWPRLQEMLGDASEYPKGCSPDLFVGMFGVPDYRARGFGGASAGVAR